MKKLKSFLQRVKEALVFILVFLACIAVWIIFLVVYPGIKVYVFIAKNVFGKEVDINLSPEEDYYYEYGY